MSTHDISLKVRELVEPIVENAGLYTDSVNLKKAGRFSTLIITLDVPYGPGAVDFEQLEALSREISAALDTADPIPGEYTLEVSTPGAERSLSGARDYSRAIGRLVEFTLKDSSRFEARVIELRDESREPVAASTFEGVTAARGLSVVTYGEKNKQRVQVGERELTFDEINCARIVVEL